jgi:hypothetical protein
MARTFLAMSVGGLTELAAIIEAAFVDPRLR